LFLGWGVRKEDMPPQVYRMKSIFGAKISPFMAQYMKKSFYTKNCMWNCKISKIGDTWIKSDFRLICGYLFVTENHNKETIVV
jgi:hypothetical protein